MHGAGEMVGGGGGGIGGGAGKEGEREKKKTFPLRGRVVGGVGCALNIRKQRDQSPPITLRQTAPSPTEAQRLPAPTNKDLMSAR